LPPYDSLAGSEDERLQLLVDLALAVLMPALIILVCTIIERFSPIERYSLRARLPGLAMNLVQVPLTMACAWPINNFWQSLGIGNLVTIPLWTWLAPLGFAGYALQFLLMTMLADFLIYWRHRTEHKLFWPIHMVHHAPTELHAANDIGHPMQVWFMLVFVSVPLSLVQVDGPETPVAAGFVLSLLTYYIHSPIDVHFGPLRKLLVDNRFHRIHHSIEPRHFDKNFGICFSIWDRCFGTAYDPAPDEWPKVGLQDVDPPRTVRDYLLLPFRAGRRQRQGSASPCDPQTGSDPCLTSTSFGNSLSTN
jgi:sterol desaturase/sphingolipid hydroxylase (fatty acid hydroxylase superfamily)